MKVKVQIIIESGASDIPVVEEIACLQRDKLLPDSLGLTLQEGKDILKNLQKSMVISQTEEYISQERFCWKCGEQRFLKGKNKITFRTPFGKLKISSPRLYTVIVMLQKGKVSVLLQKNYRNALLLNYSTFKVSGHLLCHTV